MFSTKALVMALAVVGSVAAPAARAQHNVGRDRMERAQDRHEMRQDVRQVRDDRMDLAQLEAVLAEFDRIRASRQLGLMAGLDSRVMGLMREEAYESRQEGYQKAGEVRRETAEVYRDGMRRDDRRDARDDRRDLNQEMGQSMRRRQIAQEYRGLMGRADPMSLNRKRALLSELVSIARQELRGSRQELREDRRELREDRRQGN